MTKFGAKLLTATIKNPQKRKFIYNMLMDYSFANTAIKQNMSIEWLINCVHNYLSKPNLVVSWLVGGYAKNVGGGNPSTAKFPQISAI